MNLLIKGATILDAYSKHHGKKRDVLIQDARIAKIAAKIPAPKNTTILAEKDLYISQGFCELFAHSNEPGGEQHEDIQSLAQAAVAGGYTRVYTLPNTNPPISNKAQIEFVLQRGSHTGIDIWPYGVATANLQGKALAEMHEMYEYGAAAFTDGLQPITNAGLMLKALQYVKSFGGRIVQLAHDNSLVPHGLMHEGDMSTSLGMPGMPALAEELMIQRDLALLEYTESKLHITGVSTAKGIELITKAKAKGLDVTCSVTPYHLLFNDTALSTYDSNYKVLPPLRDEKNRKALVSALKKGQIDAIATHHLPQDWDAKTKEFEYAAFGMTGLETALCSLLGLQEEGVTLEQIIQCLTYGPRDVYKHIADDHVINEGSYANICVFTTAGTTTFDAATIRSKSHNTPYLGSTLAGKILATVYENNIFLC
jgi:dihydroorotase